MNRIRVDKLDKLFSELIRKRAFMSFHGCEFCGKPVSRYQDLDTSHFIGRRVRATRYDPDNACGTCTYCNQHFLPEHPDEHTEFFKHRLGSERYEQLTIRGRMVVKVDREVIEADLKEKLKILEDESLWA